MWTQPIFQFLSSLSPLRQLIVSERMNSKLRGACVRHNISSVWQGSTKWPEIANLSNVAAHLRGMRPVSTNTKDTLTLRINSKHLYFYSNSFLLYNYCTYKLIRIEYVSITNVYKYSSTYFIQNNLIKWSRLGRNRYGTNQNSQSNGNLKGAIFILIFLCSY